MNHDTVRYNSECRGKLAFLTEGQAKDNAGVLLQRLGYSGRVYECQYCGYWHIGQLGKKRRALP